MENYPLPPEVEALLQSCMEDPYGEECTEEPGEECGKARRARRKHRERSEFESLIQRLNRVEGQIRGIRGMVEKDAYCTDILTQVSAAQSALNAFSRELLSTHIKTCVVQDIQNGDLAVVDDLLDTLRKLMK